MRKTIFLSCLCGIALLQATINADSHTSAEQAVSAQAPFSRDYLENTRRDADYALKGVETSTAHDGRQTNEGRRLLTVIDTSIAGWQSLRDAVTVGEVLLVDEANPLDTLLAKLQRMGEIDALNIVSHGYSGGLLFAGHAVSTASLAADALKWKVIGQHIAADGDILLYGCKVAEGEKGRRFVQQLAALTGADVAASINTTGDPLLGGDWQLEYASGPISNNHRQSIKGSNDFHAILAHGTQSLSGFTDNGPDLTDAAGWFKVTGNTNMAKDSIGGYLDDPSTQDASGNWFKVEADGTNLTQFELTGISISEFAPSDIFQNIVVTGNLVGGGTVTGSISNGSSGADTYTASLSNFSGKAITSFTISFDATGGTFIGDLTLVSFTTSAIAVKDSDGTLTAAAGVTEPVDLPTTASSGSPVSVFDFVIADGGSSDGFTLDVSQINLNLGGTASGNFSKLRFNLSGCAGKSAVAPSGSTVSFTSTGISIPDGGNTTCTVAAYWNDNTGITDNQTVTISIDGDTDLTVDSNKTQMSGSNTAVTTGNMATTVTATALSFTTQPSGSSSGSALSTQPVVEAVDAAGNVDTDYSTNIVLSENDAGSLSGTTTKTPSSGVATFTDITYTASADQENFQLDAASGGLSGATSNTMTSDVVATKLIFTTQPSPTSVNNGQATAFSTVPVVQAVDANNTVDTGYSTSIVLAENGAGSATMSGTGDADGNAATVTLTPSSGVTTFTGLNVTYTASGGSNETFTLRATSGSLTLADSTNITAVVNTAPTLGGTFVTAGTVNDNAITSPFSGVTVSDADADNVSVTITYTAANGTLSGTGVTGSAGSYTVTSAAPATATSNLQGIVFTPTANQVSAGNTVVTSFTLTPNDGTVNGSSDSTTQIIATSINDAPINQATPTIGGTVAVGQTATTDVGTWLDAEGDLFTYSYQWYRADDNSGTNEAAISGATTNGYTLIASDARKYLRVAVSANDTHDTSSPVYSGYVAVSNSAPVITSDGGGATASINAAENQTAVTTVTATDVDVDSLTYSISGGVDSAKFSINSSTGVLTFASAPNYESPTDSGTNGVYDVQVTVTDDGSGTLTDVQDIAVTVTNANEAPVITSNGGGATASTSINENTTAVTTVTATDVDSADTLTYSISGGADSSEFNINSSTGTLTFASAPNYENPTDSGANNVYDVQVTVTDNGTGTMTDVQDLAVTVNNVNDNPVITSNGGGASASVNAAENQTAVTTVTATDQDSGDTLTYSISGGADSAKFNINSSTGVLTFASAPNYESPTDSGTDGIYDVQVTVTDDGSGTLTDVQDIAVTVTNTNEAPVITSNGGGASASTSVNENTTAVTTLTATDVDTADILTYSISGGADAAKFSINSSTGVLTFVSAPNYESPTDSGSDNVYDVQVTVTDNGTGTLTDVQAIAVTINNVNENPVISSNGGGATASVNAAENQTAVTTVTASDEDTADTLTYSITGGADAAKFNVNSSTGVLTFASAPNYESPTDSGTNGVYDVQVTVTDDGAGTLTDVQDIAVTVTNTNEAPVITSNGGGATASTSVSENTTAVTTITATDTDISDTLTYSISGGTDAAKFSINSSTGVLTFASAPNYESPTDSGANNVYDVQVTVTDNGTGTLTDVQAIAITVNNVNENPVITSNGGGGAASVNAAENQTAVTTVTASDEDSADTLTYSISGGADAATFSINSSTGVLTFISAPNYESPTDIGANNVYDVQVTVTDNGSGALTDVQAIAVTVTNANEAPVITSNGGGASAAINVNENATAVTTVTATDTDTSDTLTYSISGGSDAAKFSINSSTGVLAFATAPDYESPTDSGGNNVYDVQVTVTDSGSGNLTDAQTIAVSVTNVNEAPVITSNGGGATGSTSVSENTTAVTTVTATDVDTSDTLTYNISGGADAAKFSINSSTGVLTFASAPDYETPTDSGGNNIYDVQVTVTDSGSGNLSDVQDIAVTVTDANEAPVITSNGGGASASVSVDENTTAVTTVTATDVDSANILTYTISGADAAKFSINSSTGALTFATAPNYESPTDSGANNVYDVQVTVTDNGSGNLTDAQNIAVTVNNVNEAPTISGTPTTTAAEDSVYSFAPTGSDEDSGDTLTYSIANQPSWASFDTATGVLSGTPTNNDVGTTTGIVITVKDAASASASLAPFNLEVTNTNDAPVISGTPGTRAVQGIAYSFTPSASDVDVGDTLSFVITNKPSWASFNTATGALAGTPGASDVGSTGGVVIGVNDGTVTTNLPAFNLVVVGDLDGDGLGDDVDTDIDGDGMDNTFETAHGLDPYDPSDAALDSDGDGLTNLEEFNQGLDPTADDNPPTVTAPADVLVNATGLYTMVDLGQATAMDVKDGEVTASSDSGGYFAPGKHTVTWSAKDAAGNEGTATQTVEVLPLVQFAKGQYADEGATVNVRVYLNGPSPRYPVQVPYTVSGTATQPDDYTLADGVVTINSGTEATLSFNTVDDGKTGEPLETVEITMGTPSNATPGPHDVHTVSIVESNVAPRVELQAEQQTVNTNVVAAGNGLVTVYATVTDPNVADSHSYDWSASDNSLVDTDSADDSFTFDPLNLPAGNYTLRVTVSDDGAPSESGSAQLKLNVVSAAPVLSSTTDSDSDGVDDATEGYGDSDNDGVSDYLDAIGAANVLQEQAGTSNKFLIETEPGVKLKLGMTAFMAGNNDAQVTESDISTNYNGVYVPDTVQNVGGLFDFEVNDLPQSAQSMQIVLPQLQPVPEYAVYRKLMPAGWGNFVLNDRNRIASAPGEQGYCPPPGDTAYTEGLTTGDWCVQLTIEDGGPNDADGEVNNAIADPGGVGTMQLASVEVSGSGALTIPGLLTLLLTWLFGWRASIRRKQ